MSTPRKALKILSIVTIVLGILTVGMGIFTIVGGASAADSVAPLTAMSAATGNSPANLAIAAGIIMIVGGIWKLVISWLGICAANNPKKTGAASVLLGITTVLNVLAIASNAIHGTLSPSAITTLIPIAAFICCLMVRKEGKQLM